MTNHNRAVPLRSVLAGAMALCLLTGCSQGSSGGSQGAPMSENITTGSAAVSSTTTPTTANNEGETTASTKPTNPTTATTASPTTRGTAQTSAQNDATTAQTTVQSVVSTTPTTAVKPDYDTQEWDKVFPVDAPMPIQQAAARVNNETARRALEKIPSQVSVVSDYDPAYAFKNHGSFLWFNGRLYVGYSRGYAHEDAPGHAMVVTSTADFKNWREETVVGAPQWGSYSQNNILAGFLTVAGGKLYAYYTERVLSADNFDDNGNWIPDCIRPMTELRRMVYTSDGENWSEPETTLVAANESPRQSLTGRWFAGSSAGLYRTDVLDSLTWGSFRFSDEVLREAVERGAPALSEASWYQTDDYVIHLMLCSNADRIWMAESYDNGVSFTLPYPTNFIGSRSMTNFGRLPDGRFYAVGTRDDNYWPLMLQISEDGYNFDKGYIVRDEYYTAQQDGRGKDGEYAYPRVLIHGEYMYILYSKQKEVMEVTRILLSDI